MGGEVLVSEVYFFWEGGVTLLQMAYKNYIDTVGSKILRYKHTDRPSDSCYMSESDVVLWIVKINLLSIIPV